jgi:RimJ/RimL family protein N-acetyltransferase
MPGVPEPTTRIRFRPYSRDDAGAVLEMFTDADARRFYPDLGEAEAARRWIDWNLHHYATHGLGLWVVEHHDDGRFLGDCGLTYQSVQGVRWLEVGYHLSRQHRGRGYASEAARACVTHAFARVNAHRVCSIVDPENMASIRVASRIHTASRLFTDGSDRARILFWTER